MFSIISQTISLNCCMISKPFPDWCRSDVVVDTLLCFIPKVAQTTKIITEMEKNKIELSIKSLINCAFLVARKKNPSCVPGPLPLHDTNIFLSLSMWTSEGDLHSDHMPWRRLRLQDPRLCGPMELGRGPMFTFPLTEEAQDERASLHTDTYRLHTHAHWRTRCTRGQIIIVI